MKKIMLLAALASCTSDTSTTHNQPTLDGREYTIGAVKVWGATYGETCDAVAQLVCTKPTCIDAFAASCYVYGRQQVYAPTRSDWDQLWSGCVYESEIGEFGYYCHSLLPL